MQKMIGKTAQQFTEKQGQYLAFIYNYSVMYARPPAEADQQKFFQVSSQSVHQMIVTLEGKGLISRTPGQARTIRVLVDPDLIPRLRQPK